MTNKETLDLSKDLGIGVKTHSSGIEEAQADRVRRRAQRDGLVRAEQPEEPGKGGASAPARSESPAATATSSSASAQGKAAPTSPPPADGG
ncbi:hypothetical protein, partial [Mumia sp.]|uniref:hypothetical protein n=1 Tax=Mumia sp. TaxID=1965300 RepID=UPI00261B4AE0